jgi:hypothetical protein
VSADLRRIENVGLRSSILYTTSEFLRVRKYLQTDSMDDFGLQPDLSPASPIISQHSMSNQERGYQLSSSVPPCLVYFPKHQVQAPHAAMVARNRKHELPLDRRHKLYPKHGETGRGHAEENVKL